MTRNRRVGTLTLGITLVVTGAVSLVNVFLPRLFSPGVYLRLWPVVLILIGLEVLVSCRLNKEEPLRYDGWAILIIGCLLLFAACIMELQSVWLTRTGFMI